MAKLFSIVLGMCVVLAFLGLMAGCTSNGGLVPLTDTMVDEAGEVVQKTGKYTADASVAKEHEVHDTLRNRDAMIAKAQKNSGMKMEWETVEETIYLPGQSDPVVMKRAMPKITYTEPAKFNQPLPTEPSEHPVWKTVRSVAKDVKDGTVVGIGINAADNVLTAAVGKRDAQYNGDVQFNQSNNQGDGTGPVTTTEMLLPEAAEQ